MKLIFFTVLLCTSSRKFYKMAPKKL